MLKNIENKIVDVLVEENKLNLPQEIKKKIQENWKNIEKEGSNVWNGEIDCVVKIQESQNKVKITCKKSDYAHYLYEERIGLPKEYECRNLSAGALIETKDHYYLVGELDKTTSYPFMLQVSGGAIDKKDIRDSKADIMNTISREVMEEININITDRKLVSNCKIKYMYISEKEEQPGVQILAKIHLNMTSVQMEEYYTKYLKYLRENNLEVEFGRIHFLKCENCIAELEKLSNPKRNYLKPLLEADKRFINN